MGLPTLIPRAGILLRPAGHKNSPPPAEATPSQAPKHPPFYGRRKGRPALRRHDAAPSARKKNGPWRASRKAIPVGLPPHLPRAAPTRSSSPKTAQIAVDFLAVAGRLGGLSDSASPPVPAVRLRRPCRRSEIAFGSPRSAFRRAILGNRWSNWCPSRRTCAYSCPGNACRSRTMVSTSSPSEKISSFFLGVDALSRATRRGSSRRPRSAARCRGGSRSSRPPSPARRAGRRPCRRHPAARSRGCRRNSAASPAAPL